MTAMPNNPTPAKDHEPSPDEPLYTPAPSFSLAKSSSLRYPGWKKSDKRRDTDSSSPLPSPRATSFSTPTQKEERARTTSNPLFAPSKPLSRSQLARIANALGVQVPSPASAPGSAVPRSAALGSGGFSVNRSASPASNFQPANTATRFLLHVIPPTSLQPPGNDKFMRGIVLPLHGTLVAQLTAIAREYALPSTSGLVVYLLDATHSSFGEDGIGEEWLGPKIGEDAWKLLWAPVLKAERELWTLQRQGTSSPRFPPTPGLPASQSSPSLPSKTSSSLVEFPSSNPFPSPPADENQLNTADTTPQDSPQLKPSRSLRPLLIASQNPTSSTLFSPLTPSASTGSTSIPQRSESSASIRTNTSTTSQSATSSFLPPLPIVGKIEFDVELPRAGWYNTWQPRQRSGPGSLHSASFETGMSPTITPAHVPRTLRMGSTSRASSPGSQASPFLSALSPRGDRTRRIPSPLHPTLKSITPDGPIPTSSASSSMLTPASAQFLPSDSPHNVPRNSLLLGNMPDEADSEDSRDELSSNAVLTSDQESVYSRLEHNGDTEDEQESSGDVLVSETEAAILEQNGGYIQMDDHSGSGSDYGMSPAGPSPSVQPQALGNGDEAPSTSDDQIDAVLTEEGLAPAPLLSEDEEDDSALDEPEGELEHTGDGDPLGDIFPSDAQTWNGVHEELQDAHPRLSDHPDRAAWVGGGDVGDKDDGFSEDGLGAPEENSAADFQEVLNLLNSTGQTAALDLTLAVKEGDSTTEYTTPPHSDPFPPSASSSSMTSISTDHTSSTSVSALALPPLMIAPLTLGSPIALENEARFASTNSSVAEDSPEATSPQSFKSLDTKGLKRPPPLSFVAPSSATGVVDPLFDENVATPTPGATMTIADRPQSSNPQLDTPASETHPASGDNLSVIRPAHKSFLPPNDLMLPYLASPDAFPITPQRGTGQNNEDEPDSDGDLKPSMFDEDEDGTMMAKRLDELERSISELSPRELAPSPPPFENSPVDRWPGGRRSAPMTPNEARGRLNGINGPRFRSEAMGAQLASMIKEKESWHGQTPPHVISLGGVESVDEPNSSGWPAIPFTSVTIPASPIFPSTPMSGSFTTPINGSSSEETRVRASIAAQDDEMNAPRQYRPPTPGANQSDDVLAPLPPFGQQEPVPPQRKSSLTSPKRSRFSADSDASEGGSTVAASTTRTASIMSRSIRRLWRKSGASTTSNAPGKTSTSRQSTASQMTIRGTGSPPPPVPSTPIIPRPPSEAQYAARPSMDAFGGRPDSRQSRPDSALDPFVFDQESRYPSLRSPSPTPLDSFGINPPKPPAPPQSKPQQPGTVGLTKTRSILKSRRVSPTLPPAPLPPPPPPPTSDEKSLLGFFGRRRSNTALSQTQPLASPGSNGAETDDGLRSDKDSTASHPRPAKKKKSPPSSLSSSSFKGLPSIMPNLSPSSAFPKTASPLRSSFDVEFRTRSEYASGEGGEVGDSQFEMLTPPMRSHELKEGSGR